MIKKVSVCLAAFMVLGLAGVAVAKSMSSGHRSHDGVNATDKKFAKALAGGGSAEIALSQVAARRTNNKAVKKFAEKMIHDHTVLAHDLVVTARPLGLATPTALDAKHRAIRAKLERLSGNALNSAYLSAMIADHTKTVSLFQNEIAYGRNLHLTNLATKNVAMIQNHLQMAHDLSGTQYKPSKIKNPPSR